MNALFRAVAISSALLIPALAAAQTNGPMTRDQVRNDLRQVEAAGYNPAAGEDPMYPADIQAAEARAAQKNGMGGAETGIGGATSGATQSGHQAEPSTMPAPQ